MAYDTDQRLELLIRCVDVLRRDVAELATLLAGSRAVTRDRATADRLGAISARHDPPHPEDEDRAMRRSSGPVDDEDDPPLDDLSTPARPA